MATNSGRFCWFDLVTKDPHKAQGFFGELFQWKTKEMPIGGGKTYTMISFGDKEIGGYMPTPQGAPPQAHWLGHLLVADANATVEQIKSLGGKVRKAPEKVGDQGVMAIVADPFDVTFAVWAPMRTQPGAGEFVGKPGNWCWHELTSPDPDKSVAFYAKIGGFTDKKMEGPMAYHILEADGKGRAGIAKPMMPNVPAMWTPYVQVASADQTADKAKRLGAQLHVPPTDIPNIGRFAIFTGPEAGTIGILQPQM
ncbi:MAG TPA: VOC family protein [Kofleriaceae bacterium]|nr:VOC family protein [Kofleriaceae bacterium]